MAPETLRSVDQLQNDLAPGSSRVKRIVYYGPSEAQFQRLVRAMSRVEGCRLEGGRADARLHFRGLVTDWAAHFDEDSLHAVLAHKYVNLLVFDLRCPGDATCFQTHARRTLAVVDALDQVEDVEERYAFHRIVVLLPAGEATHVDELMLALGQRGVVHVLRHACPIGIGADEDGPPEDPTFAAKVLGRAHELTRVRRRGKVALCAAGGGITGIFFEMGVLKCLDDCLSPGGGSVSDFDMYFGISAGAVVTGILSAGYSIDEIMAGVAGVDGGRLPRIDMRLFRLGHVDYPDLRRRVTSAFRTGLSAFWSVMRAGSLPGVESVFFSYADLIGAPFRAAGFEQMLRGILEVPGATNDFRKLRRRLFVGVTDQDARQHVLFGDEAHDEIPISVAIQASMSLNPAFTATRIRGRYYEDGAVTRTSNFAEAIRRDANLIIVIDPFLPYVSNRAGFAAKRGVLYNIDQDIRTVSYTRFENTRNWVLRRHPDVSSYTFVPANHLRRLLSISPFDHRPYLEIWRGAYLSTLKRILRLRHRMHGDFEIHGLKFDTSKAEAVAEQLEENQEPRFEDFYPAGAVQIPKPPLSAEPRLERVSPVEQVVADD